MAAHKEYITLSFDIGDAYVKKSILEDIRSIDAVIFDCDGVLIDVRESYNRAIAKAITYLFNTLTGCDIPEEIFSDEVMFLFRKSGGFNNDWDIVYGSIMFLLSELPTDFLIKLAKKMKTLMGEKSAAKKFLALKEVEHLSSIDAYMEKQGLKEKLRSFTDMLDESGIASVDRAICSSRKIPVEYYDILKNFLYGSSIVGESIIATLLEEIFCGPKLFEDIYGTSPRIYRGPGTIEGGRVIIKPETLNRLSSLIGGSIFGIASGSRFKAARHILGDLLNMFDQSAQVFLDDIEMIEAEYLKGGLKVNLRKPNPYSLFKSSWSLEPFRRALFIGDSMEDAIAVKRANMLDSRFISAEVYQYTGGGDRVIEEFLRFGCDIISPSVNEIPSIIEVVREGTV